MLDIVFRWICEECGNTHVESHGNFNTNHQDKRTGAHLHNGYSVSFRDMPRGWSLIHGQIVCPLHHINVMPLTADSQLEMAKKIYDGWFGDVPDVLPKELIPDRFK